MITFVVGISGTGKSVYCKNSGIHLDMDAVFKNALIHSFNDTKLSQLFHKMLSACGTNQPLQPFEFYSHYKAIVTPFFTADTVTDEILKAVHAFADYSLAKELTHQDLTEKIYVEITDPRYILFSGRKVVPDRIELLRLPESIRVNRFQTRGKAVPDHLLRDQRTALANILMDTECLNKLIVINL